MASVAKWRMIENQQGPCPRPRHGHRAVAVRDMMIVFGGGNDGIVDELNYYRNGSNHWTQPAMKGDIPPGCAAYGIANDDNRLFIFGGMVEYGRYSNDLYELKISNWEWKKIRARTLKNVELPRPRLGHSFTLIDNKIYLFGGLANDSENPKQNKPKYLNDLYVLELKSSGYTWDAPHTFGTPPPPRESHSAVPFMPQNGGAKLVIYGGMNGVRLGDLWILDIPNMTWNRIEVTGPQPFPRSLHTAVLINQKMYIFGGWVPQTELVSEVKTAQEREWRCTNSYAVLNLETFNWDYVSPEDTSESVPRARAGHSAVALGSRMYIWSGRDGYRKAWNNQVCCRDLWFLETERPMAPTKISLAKATTSSFDVQWTPILNADSYIIQIRKSPDTEPATGGPVPIIASKKFKAWDGLIPSSSPVVNSQNNTGIINFTSTTPTTLNATELLTNSNLIPTSASTSSAINLPGSTYKLISCAPVQLAQTNAGATSTTSTTTTTNTMSGMAALAAAAAATPRITTKTATSTNIRFITPTNNQQPESSGTKITTTGQTATISGNAPIRFITPSHQLVNKSILLKASGPIPNSQIMTLVRKASNGTLTLEKLPNSGAGSSQFVKIVAPAKPTTGSTVTSTAATIVVQTSSSSTTTTSATTTTLTPSKPIETSTTSDNIKTETTTTTSTPTAVKLSSSNVKMFYLPNSSRSQPMVISSQSVQNTQSSNPVVITSGSKTIKIPVSAIRSSSGTVQGGTSKLLISGVPSNSVRLIPTTNNTASRVVLLQPASAAASVSSSSTSTTTVSNSSSITINSSNTSTTPQPAKIPQTDGPEDDEKSDETDTNKPGTSGGDSVQVKQEPAVSQAATATTTTAAATVPATTSTNTWTLAGTSIPTDKPIIRRIESVRVTPNVKLTQTWFDVGIVKTPTCSISYFNVPNSGVVHNPERDFDQREGTLWYPTYENHTKFSLEAGASYRVRVAAINSLGRGPWSPEAVFKTCVPGFPSAPTSIKITKTTEGAHITWAMSSKNEPEITEYTVYLGIKKEDNYGFAKIYCGEETECLIPLRTLADAYIDQESTKPAIIFRIAAKNEKGYGPATQIRWLQEPTTPSLLNKRPFSQLNDIGNNSNKKGKV